MHTAESWTISSGSWLRHRCQSIDIVDKRQILLARKTKQKSFALTSEKSNLCQCTVQMSLKGLLPSIYYSLYIHQIKSFLYINYSYKYISFFLLANGFSWRLKCSLWHMGRDPLSFHDRISNPQSWSCTSIIWIKDRS